MKVLFGLVAFNLCCSFSFAKEVKMTFTGSQTNPNSRIWIPCSLAKGACMVDLGGGGSVMTKDVHSEDMEILKVVDMTSVMGTKRCDLVAVPKVTLAEKNYEQMFVYRCDWFPSNNSPMLGLDYFRGQKFAFNFSRGTFSWLEREIQAPKIKLAPIGHWSYAWASIGSAKGRVVIDTGAPLTVVDKRFVQWRPDLFEMVPDSVDHARLKGGIEINGNSFQDRNVLVIDLHKSFGNEAPDIFLGMNHIKEANWEFDFANSEMSFQMINKH